MKKLFNKCDASVLYSDKLAKYQKYNKQFKLVVTPFPCPF